MAAKQEIEITFEWLDIASATRFQRQNLCFRSFPLQWDLEQCHHATPEVGKPICWALNRKYSYQFPVWCDDILLGHIVSGAIKRNIYYLFIYYLMVDPENIGFAVETAILAAQQA